MNQSRRGMMKRSGALLAASALGAVDVGAQGDGGSAIGRAPQTRAEIVTPALVVDLDLFEANIARMAAHAKSSGIALRPHAKTHKCPEVARRQMRAGALGICTATIREAEAMAAAGLTGLLITSEIVGRPKIERLIALAARHPDAMVVVDDASNARDLNDAAGAAKLKLNVMIDVDPGLRRTGIAPGDPAAALAEIIMKLPHLRLRGIHAYSGSSAHVKGWEARRAHSIGVMTPAVETFARLKKKGMPVEILSGGSTGTYNIDSALEGMTELQVGSYVFMDIEYRDIGGKSGAVYDDFSPSLTVLATVISKNHADRATVDAGIKAFATDRKFGPEIKGAAGVAYNFGGDEHGILVLDGASRTIGVGDRLEFYVPHCDPNVNLYDRIYACRGERVEAAWPVLGRHG
ncbi:MAG: DSD1 family PLP-dependent enzyme [Blastocatellales bacterium]|nr:DSD1 family PLP-dependent enzyme [Blastocatellales bacterium]